MTELTQSQRDTVASVKKDLDALPEPARSGAYRVIAFMAAIKWPEHFQADQTKEG